MGGLQGIDDTWFKGDKESFLGDLERLKKSGIFKITPQATNSPYPGRYCIVVSFYLNENLYAMLGLDGGLYRKSIKYKMDGFKVNWTEF